MQTAIIAAPPPPSPPRQALYRGVAAAHTHAAAPGSAAPTLGTYLKALLLHKRAMGRASARAGAKSGADVMRQLGRLLPPPDTAAWLVRQPQNRAVTAAASALERQPEVSPPLPPPLTHPPTSVRAGVSLAIGHLTYLRPRNQCHLGAAPQLWSALPRMFVGNNVSTLRMSSARIEHSSPRNRIEIR